MSNDRVIGEQYISKKMRKRSWSDLILCSEIWLEGLWGTTKTLSRNSRSAGWSFNTGRADYKMFYSLCCHLYPPSPWGSLYKLVSGLGGDRLGTDTDTCASGFWFCMILETDDVGSQKPEENISYCPYHLNQDQKSTLFIGKYPVLHN